MKKVKTVLFTLLLTLTVFGVIVASFKWTNWKKLNKLDKDVQVISKINVFSETLIKKWEQGASAKEWPSIKNSCPELGIKGNVDPSYSKCNSTYLNCVLKKQKEFNILQSKEGLLYSVVSRASSLEEDIPHYFLRILLEVDGDLFNIDLEDICRDVYLPQKIYGYKVKKDTKRKFSWVWDNFNRNIFIDKFLVTNREVNEWITTTNQNLEKHSPNERPAVFLKKDKMHQYCAFKGKILASAQVLEAASFYPSLSSVKPGSTLIRYDYPWVRRNKKSFLYNLLMNKDITLSKENCKRAYVQDCFEITPFFNHMTKSSSWSGIFEILGGPFETFENNLETDRNLRASSFYFPGNHSVHKIGEKLSWDGVAHLDKNIEWGSEKPVGVGGRSLEIGFRCMKYAQN
ncbi:hypothetical protein A9Q84_18650 [Halobacteriovorax marinus]|uniref:Uncharacterized protein n=1 Tax=Halobacteriovorax marinus TaxID=97084 RepID=A0A1Y5F260_9BACT|nr:hypothetical protein A9Q84_18650 [Halobacteriovorax marinus]